MRGAGGRGFTLMEVLVAMSVFTMLGFGAMAFLVAGLSSWRAAESRRDAAERAELIFSALGEDLACLFADSAKAPGRAILYSDYDGDGRQRLCLTRTVPPAGADPRIAGSGRTILSRDDIDGVGDLASMERNLLRPPGDLLSVLYEVTPDEKLNRAARTPAWEYGAIPGPGLAKGSQLIAEGVMHIEFNFWSPRTTAWRPTGSGPGASYFWDSTMGLGSEGATADEARSRLVFARSGSLEDPEDDLFPRLIEVKVILTMPFAQRLAALEDDLEPSATDIPVEWVGNYPEGEGEHFIKADREWLSYEKLSGDGTKFLGVKRGRRGTRAAFHKAGAPLRYGLGFRMVARPPCQRGAWEVKR